VSDIPGNRQLIESGRHGLLVPVGDSAAIAAAILQIFENEQQRANMARESRRRVVENYSTAKIADRYEALFEESLMRKEYIGRR